jgi:hypothetical protein
MVRRLREYRTLFHEDDPVVYILGPSPDRAVPAGDTRRGTAWIFRTREAAESFGAWVRALHGIQAVPLAVKLRQIALVLADKDLTFVLDPQPRRGYGSPTLFKAPLPQ